MDMYNNLPWGMTPIQYNDNRKTEFHIDSVGSINNGPVTNNYYYGEQRAASTEVVAQKHQNCSAEEIIVQCIEKLMVYTNHTGRIFKQHNHWIGIYRVMVDYKLGAYQDDYLGFCQYIERIHPKSFPIRLDYQSLKKAANGLYHKPYSEWKYDPSYNKTQKPYEEMCMVVDTFICLLKENGVIH